MANHQTPTPNYPQSQAIINGAWLILGSTFLIERFVETFGNFFGKSDQILIYFVIFFAIYHLFVYAIGGYVAASLIKGRELSRAIAAGTLNQSQFLLSFLYGEPRFYWLLLTMLSTFIGGLIAKIVKSNSAYKNKFLAIPIGIFLVTFAIFSGIGNLVMVLIWIFSRRLDLSQFGDDILNWLVLFFAIWYLGTASGLAWHGRRIVSTANAEQQLKRDRRPPILYLRSFKRDYTMFEVEQPKFSPDLNLLFGGKGTLEEVLVETLSKYGPVIAASQPDEYIPPPGAARKILNKKTWKKDITALMCSSQKVVILVDSTESLIWEFQKLIELNFPHKVILALPQNFQASIWKDFRNEIGFKKKELPMTLPEKTIFMRFTSSWECKVVSGSFREKLYSQAISDLFI